MTSQPAGIPPPQSAQPCPCGSGRVFGECCEPLLKGARPAATAEELMRSRFTAHVARDYRYLHRTYRGTASQPYREEKDAPDIAWTKLVVHTHEPGPSPDVAFVEFSAYFADEQGEHVMQERSEFQQRGEGWIYTRTVRSGPPPTKSATPKVGRNEPCPCGSGKKYKHCCLGKA